MGGVSHATAASRVRKCSVRSISEVQSEQIKRLVTRPSINKQRLISARHGREWGDMIQSKALL